MLDAREQWSTKGSKGREKDKLWAEIEREAARQRGREAAGLAGRECGGLGGVNKPDGGSVLCDELGCSRGSLVQLLLVTHVVAL